MHYVRSSRLSILWNRSKLEGFRPSMGLHQGDPMFPYLFVLCMEKLSVMIQQKVADGSLETYPCYQEWPWDLSSSLC